MTDENRIEIMKIALELTKLTMDKNPKLIPAADEILRVFNFFEKDLHKKLEDNLPF